MNPRQSPPTTPVGSDVLEARFGLRIASMLSENNKSLSHDLTERLQFARSRALEQRKLVRAAVPSVATGVQFGPALALFGSEGRRWMRWLSVMPLVMLIAGLILIQAEHSRELIEMAADVDAQLLGGDLPPAAYRDAGFVEFLKAPAN